MRSISTPRTALVVSIATLSALAGCDGHTPAAPDHPTAVSPEAAPSAAPPASAAATGAQDPASVPGPSLACKQDADCAPLTPCGMTEPDMCVARSEVKSHVAECAKPQKSTYRCVCSAGKCASEPIP